MKALIKSIFGRRGTAVAAARKKAANANALSLAMQRILRPEAAGRWMMPGLAGITPTYIENVLRGAMGGNSAQQWELFDLMEDTWPRLAKDLNEVKRAVVGMDWVLHPWQEEGEKASDTANERVRLVGAAMREMRPDPAGDENDFSGTIYDLLDAWGKGTSVLEIDWEQRNAGKLGDITVPRCTRWAHPNNYAWSEQGFLGLVDRGSGNGANLNGIWNLGTGGRSIVPFPDQKFLVGICKGKTGHPLATALLRPLAWWWCAANFSADWLLNLAQLFGLPFRWANYDLNASDETVNKICSMLEGMGSAGWAAFPAGTTLDLKEASKTGDASPQGDLLDRADKQADLIILGQTLTTDVGASGSRALGDVHEGVRDEVIQSAANWVAGILNRQLIPFVLQLNYGEESEAPTYCPEKERGDGGLAFKREVFKGFLTDATVVDILANLTDLKMLCRDVGLPVNEEYIDPYVPVQDPQGRTVTGEVLKDAEGDVVGALVEEGPQTTDHAPGGGPMGEDPNQNSTEANGGNGEDQKDSEAAAYAASVAARVRVGMGQRTTDHGPQTTTDAERQRALRALATDLQPVRERFGRILQISDEGVFVEKLRGFLADMDQMKRDVSADPRFARELERINASALAIGLTERKTV